MVVIRENMKLAGSKEHREIGAATIKLHVNFSTYIYFILLNISSIIPYDSRFVHPNFPLKWIGIGNNK